MSDKIYLPSEVPDDFHYAEFKNGYVTLYNEPSALDETLEYYRIHYDYSSGLVTHGYTDFRGLIATEFEEVETSREFFDRPDSISIVLIVFIISVFGIWLLNLMSSLVKRNGLLSGLL